MKNILLTGGTGFLGRHVLQELIKEQHHVKLVTRPSSKINTPAMLSAEVVLTDDIFNAPVQFWQKELKDIDTIVHLAWYAEPGHYLNSLINIDCAAGTLIMAREAIKSGVKRFVGIGTCLEYQSSNKPLHPDAQLAPTSTYAAAKAACYQTLHHAFSQTAVNFTWGRLFYLYGEGEDTRRLVPYIHQQMIKKMPVLLGPGNMIRDFMDVKDAARKIVELAESDDTGPVNICSGKGISIQNLAEKIADQYGRRDLLKFGARRNNPNEPSYIVGVP